MNSVSGEDDVTVSLSEVQDRVYAGHVIDGRILYPAFAYLVTFYIVHYLNDFKAVQEKFSWLCKQVNSVVSYVTYMWEVQDTSYISAQYMTCMIQDIS